MSYFAPYIDASGIHLPTYDDRLEDLCAAYRSIFGVESELSASVPDYQLLSVFAKALDDVSALTLQAYNSRNPRYASGQALDLLLPQYGLTRAEGESDASARERIRSALAPVKGSLDALDAAIRPVITGALAKYRLYVNEGDTADAHGIPSHSIALVASGGSTNAIAQALFDAKAPGIGTHGTTAGTATDAAGGTHAVHFFRPEYGLTYVYPFIRKLAGADETAIREAVVPAILKYINALEIGGTLNIPQLYGVAYAARPEIAHTFVIIDMQACFAGDQAITRDVLQCAWNKMFYAGSEAYPQVEIQWRT